MKIQERLQELLTDFTKMNQGPAGCALKVMKGNEVCYEGCEGFADEASGRRITSKTVYRMYSCTKVVTAAAAMLLLERGKFLLDDPVSEYLPEYGDLSYVTYAGNNMTEIKKTNKMTIRHLLTMTSGFTYGGICNITQHETKKLMDEIASQGGVSTREFARRLAKIPLAFEPGSHWNYGLSLDVLGAVLEVISGKGLGQFLKEEFFEPLNMKDTAFFTEEISEPDLAVMYRFEEGKRIPNLSEEFQFHKAYGIQSGGGGLLSTVEDMSRFAQMLAAGGRFGKERILGSRTIDLMRQNHLKGEAFKDFQKTHTGGWGFMSGCSYGLGVKTVTDMAASGCSIPVGAFSWAGAAGTFLWADPESELSFVYAHQLMPGNREEYCHPRLLNVIYGGIS